MSESIPPEPADHQRPKHVRSRSEKSSLKSDLWARILVAIPAIIFAIVILVTGGWVFALAVGILGLICLHELYRLYSHLAPIKVGFLAIAGLALAAYLGTRHQVLLVLMLSIPMMFCSTFRDRQTNSPRSASLSFSIFAVVWIGLSLAHAILLRNLDHGAAILANVLVATFVGDTFAYIGGRLLGKHKLAPSISPNKTIEGIVIGMFGAVLAAWCAGLYEDWLSHWQALLIGIAVAVAAPLGDLFESQIKRDAGTKDTGSLFGVHGGALDRLDAVMFTVVAGYYVWLAILS